VFAVAVAQVVPFWTGVSIFTRVVAVVKVKPQSNTQQLLARLKL
jgi:hypothetical protein